MAGAQCPYCGDDVEINHDDGYGYSEDDTHQQDCHCGNTFTFTTFIHFSYDTEKADCLNGGIHDWKPSFTCPIEYTKGVCSQCGEERKATAEDMAEAIAYREKLRAKHPIPE